MSLYSYHGSVACGVSFCSNSSREFEVPQASIFEMMEGELVWALLGLMAAAEWEGEI